MKAETQTNTAFALGVSAKDSCMLPERITPSLVYSKLRKLGNFYFRVYLENVTSLLSLAY